jgi:hypothetical protein
MLALCMASFGVFVDKLMSINMKIDREAKKYKVECKLIDFNRKYLSNIIYNNDETKELMKKLHSNLDIESFKTILDDLMHLIRTSLTKTFE